MTIPIPVQQDGSMVAKFNPYVQIMEKTQTLEGTGYSLYAASLDARPGKMFGTIMSYGLSGRGGLRDVELPFLLWKGLDSCPFE